MNVINPQIARQLLRAGRRNFACSQCRTIACSTTLYAGHNKWSKIRHDKGAADAKKTVLRSQLGKSLTSLCRTFGEDSPQLASAVAAAKKAGLPKENIDSALARALGRSASGGALESMTVEAMIPPSVALLLEVETDSKARSQQDIHKILKLRKVTVTPTKFLFGRAGRVVFDSKSDMAAEALIDQIMDDAIEAGAEDLEVNEDGSVVVWTPPANVSLVAKEVGAKFGLETLSTDIMWTPNEDTMAEINSVGEAKKLAELLSALREVPEVQAIYLNAYPGKEAEEDWADVDRNLDT
ncbi:hypothetical protein MCOR25_005993 [Pyricularia grisea]|uniref:DUF28 domain-containing protein n=1 Tax=Pyricularia grisea TaxID=148305 RepID=A0A6P8BFA5_PYRGI|nr:uncharacterized protein PgNI_01328 [Pyricularia grisea]KAI6363152.1 hypothetical protein MCOR25_005993 [Pyricularia grisea]TLD15395.1 hypothetical protein PgNI_01328 [Pyricularia grisea]